MPYSLLQLVAAFAHGVIGSAHGDEADFGPRAMLHHRRGNVLAHDFELVRQAIHVVDVIVLALGVLGLVVVAAAAREVGRGGVIGAGQRAVADAVAIHILVAREAAQPVQIFGGQHLAALDGLVRGTGTDRPSSCSCRGRDRS